MASEYATDLAYTNTNTAVGAPVRLAFTIGGTSPEQPERHRFFIAADAFFGYRVTAKLYDTALTNRFGWMVGWGFGYQVQREIDALNQQKVAP